MNKLLLMVLLVALPVSSFAAQQQLQTRANTTSPSVDTNFTRQQAMNTDLYTNKADKSSAVLNWSAWANGASFTTSSPPVVYNGVLYKCIAPYTKNAGETPDTQTEHFSIIGGVADYNSLANKPNIPSTLADLSADSTHRVVTDAEKSSWNAKQSPLTAGTDYLAPTGSAANLTNFPSSLATDSEVTTAVSGKANTSAFASSAAFQAAFGWSPSGTFDTTADQTITGDWAFSSGLEASNISLNLGTLADLKIGNAQMVDDTKGNGDTNFLWSAKHTFDQLATKQATLVSGTNIKTIDGNSLIGSGDLVVSGSGSGASGYVALSAPPYSDVACTTGQYGYYGSTAYLCTGGFWASKWTLTTHSNASPATYSLTITPSGFTGADKFTYGGADYATQQAFTGLTTDASFTVTPDTGRAITCAGTGLTDNTGGSYTANTDTDNVVATCTSSAAASTYSETFNGIDGTLLSTFSNWSSINATFVETNFKISGNALTPTAAYAKAGGFHSASTSDISQIVFKGQSAADIARYLTVRTNTDSIGYAIQLGYPSVTDWRQISFFKNGIQIGTSQTISPTMPFATDHTFRLVASGTDPVTLSVYIDGSVTAAATMIDSTSPIASGHPGFYINTGSSTTNEFFDSWQDY